MANVRKKSRYAARKSKKYRKKQILKAYFSSLFFACIIVGTAAFIILAVKDHTDRIIDYDRYYEGIYIDGIDVSGMTVSEAEAAVSASVNERLSAIKLKLTYGDKQWTFEQHQLNSSYNIKEKLTEAYNIGRLGTKEERKDEIDALKKNPYKTYVEIDYLIEIVKPELYKIKAEIDYAPVNAKVSFDPSKEGSAMFSYTDERYGGSLDVEKLYEKITETFKRDTNAEIEITLDTVEPEIKRSDIEKNYTLISSFKTPLTSSGADRTFNVHKSTNAFNGCVIYPGEVLSYNATVGEVTKENGYKDAPVITPDKTFENEVGGGICQSSTTLFNAAMMADLEIVERFNHSIPSSYIEHGRDAMVSYPYADLKIKNNRSTPVFIRTDTAPEYTCMMIYGEAFQDGVTIEIDSAILSTGPLPEPTEVIDTENKYNLAAGEKHEYSKSRSQIVAECYKVYKKNGSEIKRVTVIQSTYPEVVGVTYVSPLTS